MSEKRETLEYLKQISKLDARIETKQAEVKRLWDIATNVAPVMQDAVASHSAGDGKVDTRREINQLIEKLPSEKQYKILYKRYFERKTWEQISDEMGFSRQWVHKLHNRALRNVGSLLNEKNQTVARSLH